MTQFKKMKMRINNSDHSKAVQEWLFEQGYQWGGSYEGLQKTDKTLLYTGVADENTIGYGYCEEFFSSHHNEEVNVQHLDPHLYTVHNSTCVPAKTFTSKPAQSTFDNMLKNLKHVQKAIEKADNKQQKRLQDRDRMMQKINEMLPEGFVVQLQDDVETKLKDNSPEFSPEEIVVGSVWENTKRFSDFTIGGEYSVLSLDEDGDPIMKDDTGYANEQHQRHILECFKRIS